MLHRERVAAVGAALADEVVVGAAELGADGPGAGDQLNPPARRHCDG